VSGVDAVVVGAGPNGLAAAIRLAEAGWAVHVVEAAAVPGGGCRTMELTRPGFRHDVCSTVQATAWLSPFFRTLDLAALGVEWARPEAPLAHSFADRPALVVERDLTATASRLGADGPWYARLIGPLLGHPEAFASSVLGPLVRPPAHPLFLARFGAVAGLPASVAARLFRTEEARALFAGAAAHSIAPLGQPFTAAFALMMLGTAHGGGWPVVRGGSQALADALAGHLRRLGGTIEYDHEVHQMSELPPAGAYLFDVSPGQLARIAAADLPGHYLRALRHFQPGPGVFKLDYALSDPVPWRDPACRRAGTVHLGGTFAEVAASERAVASGRIPDRPYLIAVQASLFDATRAPSGRHTLWVYGHVPNGCEVDLTERMERVLEDHAPGFRDTVLERRALTPADLERHNPNLVGGDIAGGRNSLRQIVFRPALRLSPYATPNPRIFLCSSSTPPGGGVHGMCGANAAEAALRRRGAVAAEERSSRVA
jgi:phytoene dehydrogenase-like protein